MVRGPAAKRPGESGAKGARVPNMILLITFHGISCLCYSGVGGESPGESNKPSCERAPTTLDADFPPPPCR